MKWSIDEANYWSWSEWLKIKQMIEDEVNEWKWNELMKTKQMIEDIANEWIQSKWLKMTLMIEDEANYWMCSESVCESYNENWGRWVECITSKAQAGLPLLKISS